MTQVCTSLVTQVCISDTGMYVVNDRCVLVTQVCISYTGMYVVNDTGLY